MTGMNPILKEDRNLDLDLDFRYPHALFFLDQLQSTKFRAAMAHPHNKVSNCLLPHYNAYYNARGTWSE